jgi:hypothetical protein
MEDEKKGETNEETGINVEEQDKEELKAADPAAKVANDAGL